jgi:hypothetical protein
MNESQIERLLRRAPQPAVSAGLLERLMADVKAAPAASRQATVARPSQIRFRRWMPALAFSMLFLSCLIILGVQAGAVRQLKQENKELRAATADLDPLRRQLESLDQARAQQDELAQLRADNEDLHRLEAEAASLRQLAAEIPRLRAENQALAARPRGGAAPVEDLDAYMREKAAKVACVNNLKQIGLAIRIWAMDNDGHFPTATLQMTNELNTPVILYCPSDTTRQTALANARTMGWAAPNAGDTSYQMFLSGDKDDEHPTRIIAICPIHGNVLLADGSVQGVGTNLAAHEVMVDGRLEFH